MKKIILILLIFASSILSAETVYVMSRKDYYDLCATISAYKTDYQTGIKYQFYHITSLIQDLEDIKNKLEAKEKSTFSSDIDWNIIIKVLNEYDNKKYYSGANSRLDRELTTNEKISILGGKIDLLEKQLKRFMKIKLEGKK